MGFVRHVLTVGAGGLITQVLTVATMPVLSRLYSPVSFAGWAVFMSVALIFASVATLRYELAIVLPKDHADGINVLAVSFLATVGISLIAVCLLPLIGPGLLGDRLSTELQGWLWWLPLQILTGGFFTSLTYWLIRTKEFAYYTIFQTALPLITIMIQLWAAILDIKSSSGLIMGSIGGQVIVTVLLAVAVKKKLPPVLLHSVSWSKIQNLSLVYRMYPFYMTPYTLMGAMRDRVVYFILGAFGSKGDAGFYNLSSRLVNMPNSFLSSAIRPVFFQKAAAKDLINLETSIIKIMQMLLIVTIPFWVLFLFHAPSLFALIFGEPWREAGLYAAILSVPAIPLILGNWLDRAFDVLGRQRLAFFLEALFAVASIAALFAGMWFFESTMAAVSLQALVLGLYYCVWLAVLFRLASFRFSGLRDLFFLALLLGGGTSLASWLATIIFPGLLSFWLMAVILIGFVGTYLVRMRRHNGEILNT